MNTKKQKHWTERLVSFTLGEPDKTIKIIQMRIKEDLDHEKEVCNKGKECRKDLWYISKTDYIELCDCFVSGKNEISMILNILTWKGIL